MYADLPELPCEQQRELFLLGGSPSYETAERSQQSQRVVNGRENESRTKGSLGPAGNEQ
jgi:hypothetical protein